MKVFGQPQEIYIVLSEVKVFSIDQFPGIYPMIDFRV